MKKRDEFDDPNDGSNFLGSIGPKAAFFIVLIALSFMIGVVWKLYVGGGNTDAGQNVPVIQADNQDYKIIPDEVGGMDMPHKDSTIFSSLNSDPDADAGIENLLAEDNNEDPVPRSQLFAGLNTEPSPDLHAEAQETPLDQPLGEDEERILSQAKVAEKVVTSLVEDGADAIADGEEAVSDAMDVPEKVEPVVTETTAVIEEKIQEPVKEVVKEEVKKEEPKPEVKKAETAKPASGDYFVQLASVRDRAAADAEWKKLKSKYGSALSGFDYRVETANLPAGTFYRIQAGPVSKAEADKACAAVKRVDKDGCLVKKK